MTSLRPMARLDFFAFLDSYPFHQQAEDGSHSVQPTGEDSFHSEQAGGESRVQTKTQCMSDDSS